VRRWKAGDWLEVGGQRWRVVAGRKETKSPATEDLRIEWPVDGRYVPIPMMALAVLADFFYDNEEALYPRVNGYKGGRKPKAYMTWAADHGYERAEAGLQAEKRRPTLWVEAEQDGSA
jgi:hypothetical protein